MKFAWTTLRVRDFERSIDFYSNIIGLKIAERMGTDDHRVIMFGEDGATRVELIWEPVQLPEVLGTGVNLGFFPDDLDAYKARLEGLGMETTPIISPSPDVRFFFVNDPDGYKLQFVQLMK